MKSKTLSMKKKSPALDAHLSVRVSSATLKVLQDAQIDVAREVRVYLDKLAKLV
jgi:hypothetical protein